MSESRSWRRLKRGKLFNRHETIFLPERLGGEIKEVAAIFNIMSNRKGKFIGAYIDPLLADYVRERAQLEGKTLTQALEAVIKYAKEVDWRNNLAAQIEKRRRRQL